MVGVLVWYFKMDRRVNTVNYVSYIHTRMYIHVQMFRIERIKVLLTSIKHDNASSKITVLFFFSFVLGVKASSLNHFFKKERKQVAQRATLAHLK